jgi:hypothetical protein
LARLSAVLALAGLLLTDGVVAVASPSRPAVDGTYTFNANGWTGTLAVSNAATGWPSIDMRFYDGATEHLTGFWSAAGRTLTIGRPLSGGVSQTYTLYLGDHHPSSPVFGGFFTESDTGATRYGAFAHWYQPPAVPHTLSTRLVLDPMPLNLLPGWDFNGNGWTGSLSWDPLGCGGNPTQLQFDGSAYWETVTGTWDPSTQTLTLVRSLSGGLSQTYTLYRAAAHVGGGLMLGGFFTQSDSPGLRFAAFAEAETSFGC